MAANVETLDLPDDLVTQFCTVTGASRELGRQLLEVCHGNLEMAIGMHMDQEEGGGHDGTRPSGSGLQSRSHPADAMEPGAAATASGEDEDQELNGGLRAPIPQRHEVLVEEAPKLTGFRGRRRTPRSVFDGFRDFQAEARQQENLMVAGRSFAKKHTLEDLFRPPIDMTFKGAFLTARDAGKSQNKWLMVNIQNVQEFCCQVLNRDIWSNLVIKKLVKKHFIFWQMYNDSEEGKNYMQFYKVDNWPYVAVIDPVTGENMVTWNKVEPSSFTDLVNDFVEEHPNPENPDGPPSKRQKRVSSIVDESEEAQLEAAIKASLTNAPQPTTATSSTSTVSISSAAAVAAVIDTDSDQSDQESDELETFTGSEDDSRDISARKTTSHNHERLSSSQARSFSAVSARSFLPHPGSSSRSRISDGASSSGVGAAGVSSPGHSLLATVGDTSLPSTSGSRDIVQVVDDSENENSLGFRESYANTPNSVDIMGGRSWEFHTLDSSSNSSSLVGSGVVALNNEEDTIGCDRLSGAGVDSAAAAADPSPWRTHFGNTSDPSTNLIVRFPDGKKEQLSLPCSSKLQALFVFCSSKGYAQDSYELVVNFPLLKVSSLDPGSTMKEARLHPQATIYVQAR